MPDLTPEVLAELKNLHDAAIRGLHGADAGKLYWEVNGASWQLFLGQRACGVTVHPLQIARCLMMDYHPDKAMADLLCLAVNHLPALLAAAEERDKLRAVRDQYGRTINSLSVSYTRLNEACELFRKNSEDAVAVWEENRELRAERDRLQAELDNRPVPIQTEKDAAFDAMLEALKDGQRIIGGGFLGLDGTYRAECNECCRAPDEIHRPTCSIGAAVMRINAAINQAEKVKRDLPHR